MKIAYKLPINNGVAIFIPDHDKENLFDNITVGWEMDSKDHLAFVKITFSGISVNQLQLDKNGRISPKFPELEEQGFYVSSYVANRIFIQTGVEILELQYGIYLTPEILPETPTDGEFLATHEIALDSTFPFSINLVSDRFEKPDGFEKEFGLSKAYGNYADGLRVASPFLRYEQFYKVLGHFCDKEKAAFDKTISGYVFDHDQRFDQAQIEKLRLLRNRIIHPAHNKGHLNPSSITSTREVQSALPLLQSLVKILLQNHPG